MDRAGPTAVLLIR